MLFFNVFFVPRDSPMTCKHEQVSLMVCQRSSQTRVLFGICVAGTVHSMYRKVHTVHYIYIYIHIQIPCAGRSKSHDTAHHCPPSLTRKKLTLSNCQRSIDLKDCQHHFNTTHKFDSKKCLARSKSLLTNQALPSQPRWRKAKIFLRVMTGLCSQDLVEEVWPLAH